VTAAAIGPAAIWAAILFAIVAVFVGRRWALAISAVAASAATVVLAVALVAGDFSLTYVAQTTSFATPWPYRLAAVWGGMDGSMLFYTAMTLVVAAFALRNRIPVRVASVVGLGLLATTLIFADPFVVADIPAVDGEGLLAILQHPAMIYHPPILYLGLTTLVVPFALSVELVWARKERQSWMGSTRRWLYVSWTLLTVGMAAGANWAYVELGWGGYWAWDPVENTALMPWLAATVFFHTSRIEDASGRMRRWNVLFASLPFALSVMGVYLTRSGATGSIHSFAEDPVVGRVLLASAGAAAVLIAVMALRSEIGEPWGPVRVDRSWWLTLNAALLTTVLVFITAGSAYPAFSAVFFGQTVAVDTRYFVVTVLPVTVIVAIGLTLSLGLSWKLYVTLVAFAIPLVLLIGGSRLGVVLLAPALASLALLGVDLVRRRPRGRQLTVRLAHVGMAVFLVGVAGSSFGDEFAGSMTPGDVVEVEGHEITLEEVDRGETDRFVYVRAAFLVDGVAVEPEIRAYEDQGLPVAEPAVRSTPLSDVTVAVSLLFPDGSTVAVSVFVRPLVWWVWVGSALMALVGLFALFSRTGAAAAPRRLARVGRRRAGTTSDTAPR
jgi:cytochrome c-type biogenesis protein CcmF